MEQILGCCWSLSPNSKVRAIDANNAQLVKLWNQSSCNYSTAT